MADESSKPVFLAYAVQKGEESKDASWCKIGAVFAHRDGKGYTVQLQALPVSASIVLREPKEEKAPARR